MAKQEWQLGSGASGDQWLLGDGKGQQPETWDPKQGEQKPQVPQGLPRDVTAAFKLGYQQAQEELLPKSFTQAIGSELRGAAADTGMQIGRELRNQWADAFNGLLHREPPPPPTPHDPSKLRRAAGFVGRASWKGAKWAIKSGIGAARTGIGKADSWRKNRSTKKTNNPDNLDPKMLVDPNVIDGEWREATYD